MKKNILRVAVLAVLALVFCGALPVFAEEADEPETGTENISVEESATSISITPVSKVLSLSSGKTYEDSFIVTNNGSSDVKIETYASPYSYVYSEAEDKYNLGFNTENNYTQISRWITFKSTSGNYEEKTTFTVKPSQSLEIHYKITTPKSIPAGGQYAVIFAHTLSASTTTSGIRTEACPGIIVYGRSSEGETIVDATISNLSINKTLTGSSGDIKNLFNGSGKVKNNGNTDFTASGVLKVTGLFGDVKYETASTNGRVSIIPDAELEVTDKWEETPSFGFFRVKWSIEAGGKTESIERIIFLMSPIAIIISIIVLTIIIVGVIILIKKRKVNRSRNAV